MDDLNFLTSNNHVKELNLDQSSPAYHSTW